MPTDGDPGLDSEVSTSRGDLASPIATATVPFRRTRRKVLAVSVLVGCALAATAFWQYRDFFLVLHFRAVIPGQVYASAFQGPIPLKNTVDKYKIATLLSLVAEGARYDWAEQRFAIANGVRFCRVPMSDDMPLDVMVGKADQAVAILADPANQPVLVHCRYGKHRTGLVIAIFRVRHCGWSVEQAEAELEKWGAHREEQPWVYRAFRASVVEKNPH